MGLRLALCAVCLAAIVLVAGRLSDRNACRDARRAAFMLGVRGVPPQRALALAREATRRGPDVFSAWVALEAAVRRSDPGAARRAEARARALNPRWTGPAPLPGPPGSAGP